MSEQPFLLGKGWIVIRDGDETALSLYKRHYSARRYADGRSRKLLVGPGYKLVLLRDDARALFVWRKFKDDGGQSGVNCAVFRNEGDELASRLIVEAEEIARLKWPKDRFYTYVDPREVRPTMVRGHPVWGFCFYQARWHFDRVTKGRKHVLEKRAA